MNRTFSAWSVALVLGVLAIGLTGCSSQRLRAERDALYTQNQELQDRLTQSQAAHDAAIAERDRAAADLAKAQADLAAKEAAKAAAPAPRQTAGTNADRFKGIDNVESFENNGLLTVRVQGDVLFASGKADLKAASRRTLADIAKVLKRDYANNAIRVGGYTDSDPIRKSKWKDNEELSLARANAVRSYLRDQGISASRLFAAGYGSTNPRQTKALSRRVEIVVVLNDAQ